MVGQSFFSVVRVLVPVLISVTLSACTAQYTRDLSRSMLRDLGLGTSIKVSRTGSWSLPEGTAVHLAPTSVVGLDPHGYPRLSRHLDQLLEAIASEWFHRAGLLANNTSTLSEQEFDVRIHLSLTEVADKRSSVREVTDSGALSDDPTGRDRLQLVMKVYDARSGKLLDTLTGEAVSGWRWREQRVGDLAEPTLRTMLARLRGAAEFE